MNTALQEARAKAKLTQAQVAASAKMGDRQYQNYEYGNREPGVRTAIRIADALGVSDLRELWGQQSEPDGNPAEIED